MDRSKAKSAIKNILTKFSRDTHNIFTPFELCEEMLSRILSIIRININYNILVECNLEFLYVLSEKICRDNMTNVWFLTPCKFKARAAMAMGVLEEHILIYEIKQNKIEIRLYNNKQLIEMPKFDIIVGNPPFQPEVKNTGDRKGSGIKLWHKFIEIGFDSLNEGGIISLITPSHWRLGNFSNSGQIKNVQKLMWKYDILDVKIINDYFDKIAAHINLDYWVIQKNEITKDKDNILQIKNYYPVKGDYDLIKSFFNDIFINNVECYDLNISDNRSYDFDCIRKSKNGDENHSYPHLVTISQLREKKYDWYDRKTCGFDDKKVMITSSVNLNTEGNFLSIYDDGKLGCGHSCCAYKVDNEIEGKKLEYFLNNSKIIRMLVDEFNGPNGYAVPFAPLRKIPKTWVEKIS